MDDETQKIIAEQMKILPKDVVSAIVSVDYKTKLQEITKRQRLLIDQAGKLEMETTLVMIGLEPLADYVTNLQRELGLTVIRAKEIAMDVSENIFKPIRVSLQTMNEATEKEDEKDLPSAPPQAPDWQEKITGEREEPARIKFTDSNETNLNRDQILNEIENPSPNREATVTSTALEIKPTPDILVAKLTGTTIVSQQIVDAKPEIKLPEIKTRPSSGVDPYREPLS